MSSSFRVSRPRFAAPFLLFLATTAAAQVPVATAPPAAAGQVQVDTSAWLYKGSDITPDAAWSFGTLPNGVRYAVRKNGVPPGQVAIRVRVDAGSLNETDAERGFAHLIEHLTFRGSQYVPDGEAKRVWQRFGATFGSDTNAQTTPTSTTYKLDLPSATAANVDESLHILSGMMAKPAINGTSLPAELPVVLAEQREQPGPQVRFGDLLRSTFFAGQPLADRSPIGHTATLQAATPASVLEFHDRWYRPERAQVIVVGDMDPAVLGQLIAKNFAGWRGVGPVPAETDFGSPTAAAPATAALVEPGLPPVVALAVMRPWHFNADTVIFNQKRLVDVLATRLINRRLETRARAGGSFLQATANLDDVSRSANVTTVNVVPVGDDWAAALKDVRAVIADAQATPATQAEVDREYADFDTIMRTSVETARVEAGAKEADDMADALDIRETVTSPQTSYDILRDAKAKGMFTPAALLESTRRIFQGTATRAVVNTRIAEPTAATALASALSADVSGLAGKRRAQAAVTFADLPPLGKAATVIKRETIPDLNMERVELSNGVRVLVYANTSETGRVYVRARWGGGYNALPASRPSAGWAADLALIQSGVGKLDQNDLDQLTQGRRIGLDFEMEDDAFAFNALTSPADLGDQLRLMAAKLAHPAWDPAPVARARAVTLAGYDGYDGSPNGVLSRDLEGLLHDGDPRWATPSRAAVSGLTAADFRRLWQPLLATGPIEVSVFGDVKADEAIAAVARTFGALAPRRATSAAPPPIRFPAHNVRPVVRTHTGPADQAAAVIAWPTGAGSDGIAESNRLDVLSQVFSDRLFERLRQEAGASYSPSVQSRWPVGLPGGGALIAVGQVKPDKVPYFLQLSRQIAADLVAKPIPDDELQRIMRPMAQFILRASSGNQFWLGKLAGGAYDPKRIEATRRLAQDFVAITPADLQATAAKYLRPDRDWTMAVVPKGQEAAASGPAEATPTR